MVEIIGDLFDESIQCDARCITTNNIVNQHGDLIMGAGVALTAKNKFPDLPKIWGSAITPNPSILVTHLPNLPYALVSFPTKYHWRNDSNIDLIQRSANLLVQAADCYHWHRVLLPRPGCKNGGLSWIDVKPLLTPIFDDRFIVISGIV